MGIEQKIFGRVDGTDVRAAEIDGGSGVRLQVVAYGARLARLLLSDRAGRPADVVLGFDTLDDYIAHGRYFGATCGRYGNRIAGGTFPLDGRTVVLTRNEPPNHLHGGSLGFDRKVWTMRVDDDRNAVAFSATAADGEQGYPGALAATTTYRLDGRGLEIEMRATSDRLTVVNLVNHAYWNLAGQGSGDIRGHHLVLDAAAYTPVDAALIPTGELRAVAGTPFDFRAGKPVGQDLDATAADDPRNARLARGGYDHNWCLDGEPGALRRCARLVDPPSGRGFELDTSEPGVQVYTAGHLSDATVGRGGMRLCRYAGITFETQKYPDSPNFPHFPSARLDPGQEYVHRMRFRFFDAPGY